MANDLKDRIVREFMSDIVRKLSEATIIARTADALCKPGRPERAFASLLGIEKLFHDAQTLLNATSVVRRCEQAVDLAPS